MTASTFETKDGRGALFTNTKKASPHSPDYIGNVRVGGQLYRLAAWNEQSRSGKAYLSLRVEPERPKPNAAGDARPSDRSAAPSQPAGDRELNDPIPF